jgi:hypothetical protein
MAPGFLLAGNVFLKAMETAVGEANVSALSRA